MLQLGMSRDNGHDSSANLADLETNFECNILITQTTNFKKKEVTSVFFLPQTTWSQGRAYVSETLSSPRCRHLRHGCRGGALRQLIGIDHPVKRRVAWLYGFRQILVTFSEFEKMEQMCHVLLEKLDKSVHVGAPQFFHSASCLSQLRCLTC